jgi:hypothetical protein
MTIMDDPRVRRRFWITLALTIGLLLLATGAVAAQGGQRTGAAQAAPSVTSTDGSGFRASQPNAAAANFTVHLPAVLRGYAGCTTRPTLISPANGSTLSTITPLDVWDDGSNPAATSFRLQIAKDAAFTDLGASLRTGIHGQWQFRFSINLEPSRTYYWRAYLLCGTLQGPYSEVWSFTTGSGGTVLPAPVLVAPANGSTVTGTMASLQWSPVPGAVEYLVRWRTPDEGGYTYEWVNATQVTEYFLGGTTYEWWVSSRSDYAIGTDSERWQFTTPAGSASGASDGSQRGFVVEDSRGAIVVEHQGR